MTKSPQYIAAPQLDNLPPAPFSPASPSPIPPYLRLTECLELEQLPLQVALLTMEIATLRAQFANLSQVFGLAASAATPAILDLEHGETDHDDGQRDDGCGIGGGVGASRVGRSA